MRVLAVGSLYPPHHLGGYELVWRSAMRHLRTCGHEVRVLSSDVRLPDAGAEEDSDTFRELQWYWRDHAWPRLGWRARLALERHNAEALDRHLAEFAPDVVSWWAMGGMSLALIERVRRAGLPAVAFVHDDWLIYGPVVDRWTRAFRGRPRAGSLAERLTGLPGRIELEAAAHYVLVSETVRARARAAGYDLDRSTIAHSGIDPAYLDTPPSPVAPWRWRLQYVGRIDERKGVGDAVAALAQLPAEATLTVVGGGQAAVIDRLRAQAQSLGVGGRLRLQGMRSRDELMAVYESADAVLFPVRWQEPWGLVPLEAMARGRPVVASGRGGSGEYLFDGQNCVLAPAEDPVGLAAAITRLASDRALRERIRSGGLQTAARYTESAFNEAVLAALLSAASGRPSLDPR